MKRSLKPRDELHGRSYSERRAAIHLRVQHYGQSTFNLPNLAMQKLKEKKISRLFFDGNKSNYGGGCLNRTQNGQNYSSSQLSNISGGAEKELKHEVQRTKRKHHTLSSNIRHREKDSFSCRTSAPRSDQAAFLPVSLSASIAATLGVF